MPPPRLAYGVVTAALGALLAACGGSAPEVADADRADAVPALETPAGVARKAAPGASPNHENTPPQMTSLRIEPDPPVPGKAVRAYATARDADGDPISVRYAWKVDGETVGADTAKLLLAPDLSRGSVIAVAAVASDGRTSSEPLSAEARVPNQVPVLASFQIEPSGTLSAGIDIEVMVETHDADGDEVEVEYVWRVNDSLQLAAHGPVFATRGLASGTEVVVTVRPFDGHDYGREVASPPLVVGNQPPRVVSRPGPTGPDLLFNYQIEVVDPDAVGPPSFELASGPEGMQVDEKTGRVEWKPAAEQTGSHPIRVIVDDGQGARVAHDFQIVVQPPASAARGS